MDIDYFLSQVQVDFWYVVINHLNLLKHMKRNITDQIYSTFLIYPICTQQLFSI